MCSKGQDWLQIYNAAEFALTYRKNIPSITLPEHLDFTNYVHLVLRKELKLPTKPFQAPPAVLEVPDQPVVPLVVDAGREEFVDEDQVAVVQPVEPVTAEDAVVHDMDISNYDEDQIEAVLLNRVLLRPGQIFSLKQIQEACAKYSVKVTFDLVEPTEETLPFETVRSRDPKAVCLYCNAEFTNVTAINPHLIKIHNDISYKCPICKQPFNLNAYTLYTHFTRKHRDQNVSVPKLAKLMVSHCQQVKIDAPQSLIENASRPEAKPRRKRARLDVPDEEAEGSTGSGSGQSCV